MTRGLRAVTVTSQYCPVWAPLRWVRQCSNSKLASLEHIEKQLQQTITSQKERLDRIEKLAEAGAGAKKQQPLAFIAVGCTVFAGMTSWRLLSDHDMFKKDAAELQSIIEDQAQTITRLEKEVADAKKRR